MGRLLALQFAAHGVPIFPVRVFCEDGHWRKQPRVKEWHKCTTAVTAVIDAWWQHWPDAFPGVPLAPLDLIVLDADRHPGGPDGVEAISGIDLPLHPVVTTLSNGEHHFFRQPAPPAERIRFVNWHGGQVLGDGRFVVGYAVEPFVAHAPVLPTDLLQRLGAQKRGNGKNTTHMRPSIAESGFPPVATHSVPLRSKYLLRKVESAERGNRNSMLHWASCRFGNMIGEGKFKSREVAEKLLSQAAQACGLWREDKDQCLRTIRSGLETGIEEWRIKSGSEIKGRMCVA